ncbi:MAG: Asp-tRNA(Asn)/Glu-tRNA(Gln) amidotransferase subunit GatB [Chloroflexi bacterium]|nr:Asp-tRNA(Asn)/Glu-tRNA(Gln) amidotransferase subunit GatB [Chloroflexota bacterium]
MEYEAVIGLEVHAELLTQSKMFCACPVVDSTQAAPNTVVCPVCTGLPGVLPVVNQQAVEQGIRVALALNCTVAHTSLFARKNYFYPDLPKGYQISQYEYPLAEHGYLPIRTGAGERRIRIHRVHLEEDTGKLTHVQKNGESYSLVDLNRAGVPLLEIVSEPDMHTVEEVRAYASELRTLLRNLGVNSGDMEKGVIRFEANVSVRPLGSQELGTRVEIKNLNSFRALERSSAYQIEQQIALLERGEKVRQETLGWDEGRGVTYSQRSKEEAHDYRYFPEPDLPPLVVDQAWVDQVAASLPELPYARLVRFEKDYSLPEVDARLLVEDQATARYFEEAVAAAPGVPPRTLANWITGELFAWMNQCGEDIQHLRVKPAMLARLLQLAGEGQINLNTAKTVLNEMLGSGQEAAEIIAARGLQQVSDSDMIAQLVRQALEEHPQEVASYLAGKETLANWFFGQVMRAARGKGNPQVIRAELEKQLARLKSGLG